MTNLNKELQLRNYVHDRAKPQRSDHEATKPKQSKVVWRWKKVKVTTSVSHQRWLIITIRLQPSQMWGNTWPFPLLNLIKSPPVCPTSSFWLAADTEPNPKTPYSEQHETSSVPGDTHAVLGVCGRTKTPLKHSPREGYGPDQIHFLMACLRPAVSKWHNKTKNLYGSCGWFFLLHLQNCVSRL